jgi:hypothetical protein
MYTRPQLHTVIVKRQSESELHYDCRFTENQFILATSPLRLTTSYSVIVLMWHPFTRGGVCNLQLLLVFASAVILGSESCGTYDHILLSLRLQTPPTCPRIYISQELSSLLVASYDSQSYNGSFDPTSTRDGYVDGMYIHIHTYNLACRPFTR